MLPGPFFSTAVIGAEALKLAGSDDQKKDLLAKLAEGKLKTALAFHESGAAWTAESVSEMTATQTEDGWILNGEKRFVQDGAAADMLIVAARTGEDAENGITLFLVETDNADVDSRELKTTSSDRMSVMTFVTSPPRRGRLLLRRHVLENFHHLLRRFGDGHRGAIRSCNRAFGNMLAWR